MFGRRTENTPSSSSICAIDDCGWPRPNRIDERGAGSEARAPAPLICHITRGYARHRFLESYFKNGQLRYGSVQCAGQDIWHHAG